MIKKNNNNWILILSIKKKKVSAVWLWSVVTIRDNSHVLTSPKSADQDKHESKPCFCVSETRACNTNVSSIVQFMKRNSKHQIKFKKKIKHFECIIFVFIVISVTGHFCTWIISILQLPFNSGHNSITAFQIVFTRVATNQMHNLYLDCSNLVYTD